LLVLMTFNCIASKNIYIRKVLDLLLDTL